MPSSTKPNADQTGGPTREAGGTTGAGNPSAGSASRTGGATGGVSSKKQSNPEPTSEEKKLPASANDSTCDSKP